jgi:hypothetical protein
MPDRDTLGLRNMGLQNVELRNVGPIAQATLQCADLTVFVGPTGSGKSRAIRALHKSLDASEPGRSVLVPETYRGTPATLLPPEIQARIASVIPTRRPASSGQRQFKRILSAYEAARPSSVHWLLLEHPERDLHPEAVSAALLLLTHLLAHGRRLCLTTHSTQVLDWIWAMRTFRDHLGGPTALLDLFRLQHSEAMHTMARKALETSVTVYYFDRTHATVHDISALDPGAESLTEASWGGLTEFSGRATEEAASLAQSSAAKHAKA